MHESGFSVARVLDNHIRFMNQKGMVIPPNGERSFRGNIVALRAAHTESGFHFTPDTPVTRWRGERMDDQLAVQAPLRRDRG